MERCRRKVLAGLKICPKPVRNQRFLNPVRDLSLNGVILLTRFGGAAVICGGKEGIGGDV